MPCPVGAVIRSDCPPPAKSWAGPPPGPSTARVPLGARRREVEGAGGGHLLDGIGDEVVLERRLAQVGDVVDEDVAMGGVAQAQDVGGEGRLVGVGGGGGG